MPNNITWLLLAIAGIYFGSVITTLAYRLPKILNARWISDASLLLGKKPPSVTHQSYPHCPRCKHILHWWENIPIFSYILLRGRCRQCRTTIPLRYCIIEILMGMLTCAAFWHFGMHTHFIAGIIFISSAIMLALIDFDTQLLPDEITLPLLWLGLLINTQSFFVSPESAICGAALGYLGFCAVARLFYWATNRHGMGAGDCKYLAALGAWFGWQSLLPIVLIASATGIASGMLGIVLHHRNKKDPLPFGPYLALAGVVQLFMTAPFS